MILPCPENLPGLPTGRERHYWGSLPGSALAHALAASFSADSSSGMALVVCEDTSTAYRVESELNSFLQDQDIVTLHLPDWETLPYDNFSPHQDIVSQRLLTLYSLQGVARGVMVVSVNTLMGCLAPRDYINLHSFSLSVGERVSINGLRQRFEQSGYRCTDTVFEHGEFAVRGSLFDIYPMGSPHPFRVDLFDDEVESIRYFDPESQKTIEAVDAISLLPAREFPLSEEAINRFQDAWHEHFPRSDARKCPVYQDVSAGLASPGIEYYLPLFFEQTASLVSYLPQSTRVFALGDIKAAAEHFWQDLHYRFEQYGVDPLRPLLPPETLFTPVNRLFESLKPFPLVWCSGKEIDDSKAACFNLPYRPCPELAINHRLQKPLSALQQAVDATPGRRTILCAESAGRLQVLLELLEKADLVATVCESLDAAFAATAPLVAVIAPLSSGFLLTNPEVLLVTEKELFGDRVLQRRRRNKGDERNPDLVVKNLTELRPGAPVVHLEHGVGRYEGLVTLSVDGLQAEFIQLVYADDAKLYVPVASLAVISRYSGADDEHAPLHRLGSGQWEKARSKAAEKIRDVAAELLDIHARRAARKGYAFTTPEADYALFASEFPFEETEDQQTAIEAVVKDMASSQPMDRLVCGDVGFGKTEVAMRAAFIAVHNRKQAAILVPTTLLAQQHYDNFRDRFANWPVKIEVFSRFRTASEQDSILQQLSSGEIDIVIGTHKLLSSKMDFSQLGLVIIDEEHRFGVQQKERLKSLRAEVDILTLTATPIPRTLNMAMSGMRELSIIATPPARRLSVKTFVRQQDVAMIKEAILRELLRGGQVYYLHNDVKSIARVKQEIEALVPEAKVEIGHGQMRERRLEQVMADFYHRRFNVLVCTTIIETGIDVPNANTIIIDRADKFGLAQLHQLRGRVGRSHHQAYAYLLTPHPKSMSKDALKRLEAISLSSDLGSGFMLATHDLEIRGAGELLGESQSGQIQSIGFTLYMDMLERAVKAIREGRTPDESMVNPGGAKVELNLPALIPEDYLPDTQTRLTLYKRIALATDDNALRDLQVEMIDRFGLLPEQIKFLFRQAGIKLRCDALGVRKLTANARGGRIEFLAETAIDPLALVKLVQARPTVYKFSGANALVFTRELADFNTRLNEIQLLLENLQPVEEVDK